VGGIKDKFCIAKLTQQVSSLSLDQLLESDEMTTVEYLRQFGFSSEMINRFFTPFFGGVFLDPELSTSSRMFLFVFQMFAKGKAALPAHGMQAISNQLADSIPNENILYNTKVESLNQNSVRITEGQEFTSQAVVLATDWNSASTLVEEFKPTHSRSVSCLYFSAKEAPIQKPILVLNGNNKGPINNLCVPSHVAPNYAPKDRHLISATVLQSDRQNENNLIEEVRQQMVEWFGSVAADYEHIKTYTIPHALPDQSPPFSVHHDSRLFNGVFVCGDYRNTASINGAMQSGLNAADSVLKHLYQKEPSALT
jgi:phytoene dehydrogenase-like protein